MPARVSCFWEKVISKLCLNNMKDFEENQEESASKFLFYYAILFSNWASWYSKQDATKEKEKEETTSLAS